MAKYRAYYTITFGIDIEAGSYDEAEKTVENMTSDEVFALADIDFEYCWPDFDELIEL